MQLSLLLVSICCLLATISAQGFNPNRGLNELPIYPNAFRRQLGPQHHIHNDGQHHPQQQQQQQHPQQQHQHQQPQYFLQQSPSIEIPLVQPRIRNSPPPPPAPASSQSTPTNLRFGPGNPVRNNNITPINSNHIQQNQQFQRSTQNQLYTPNLQQQPQQQQQQFQQQPLPTNNPDMHQQNFLALRNFANQEVGPHQSLPHRSYSNKPFQPQPQPQTQQQIQQQYSTLPDNGFAPQVNFVLRPQSLQQQQQQQQQQQHQPLQHIQQKLPTELPVPTFQPQAVATQNPQYSTIPQYGFQSQQQRQQEQQQAQPLSLQQQLQQQQQSGFPTTPNLGLPLPQIFPNLQSPPSFAPHQQFQQSQQQPQYVGPQFSALPTVGQAQTPDQEYKEKLIQKHEQFVQKQYEKSQNKVKQQHEEFVAKQQSIKQQVLPAIIGTPAYQHQQQLQLQQQYQNPNYVPPRGRPVDPTEFHLFSNALHKYHQEHPTTTTTTTSTTTTTTPASTTAKSNKNIYAQVKAELGKYGTKTGHKKPVKTIGRDDLLKQLKAALAEAPPKELGNKTFEEMDIVLPNGQRVQVIRTTDPNLVKGQQAFTHDQFQALLGRQGASASPDASANHKLSITDVAPESTKDLVLPNGSKVQILRSPNPEEVVDTQTLPAGVDLSNLASLYGGEIAGLSNNANSIASSAVIQSDSDEPPSLEELAKRGLIPDGYEIEGLSSSKPKSSKSKPAPTLPPKKKATYVYLEEQADGSFKIQGVKANGEKETKTTGSEVESILDRIRSGEIKLPPSVQRLTLPNDEIVEIESGNIIKTTRPPQVTYRPETQRAPPLYPFVPTTISTTTTTTPRPTTTTTQRPTTTTTTPRTSSQRQYHPSRTTPSYYQSTTSSPLIQRSSSISHLSVSPPNNHLSNNPGDTPYYTGAANPGTSTTTSSTTSTPLSVLAYGTSTHLPVTERLANVEHSGSAALTQYTDTLVQESENKEKSSANPLTNPSEDLVKILKSNGLYAMAKYLRQSGLDTILNETGPYTIFVPTDKAFKNLLIQLGGPERAEEKFKANPRLLSGLLLHHVIPGAFEIASLQDEMTGVSLAGTQLRVNQYTMHDQEWNDVTLTTINGAMVVLNKKDITIPQGIAHAVDRVMFPLPVGDILQTLQSDRENRFSNFLKIIYTSGLSEKLQSKSSLKTYTVFAPIDKSFADIESDTLEKLFNDKESAEEFAMKHIVSGSLFSAGMRFYQVKDSLLTGKTVILQKTSAGKIKVNDAQMITSNIPATNGVIHALDGVLA